MTTERKEADEWLASLICSCGHSAERHSEGDGCSCCDSDVPYCWDCGKNGDVCKPRSVVIYEALKPRLQDQNIPVAPDEVN